MTQEAPAQDTQNQDLTIAQMLRLRRNDRDKVHELTLPSIGLAVKLKRPSITKLMSIGKVPDALASKLMNMNAKEVGEGKVNTKDLSTVFELQRIIAKEALVSPKVVDENANVDADEIELADLDDEDLSAIMEFVTEGVQADENAKSFRNNG